MLYNYNIHALVKIKLLGDLNTLIFIQHYLLRNIITVLILITK